LTVQYPAASNIWLPVAGSYPLPRGKTPRTPKYPDVSQSPPGSSGSPGAGRVRVSPIGWPSVTSNWSVTLPEPTRRVVTPSVTVIQDGISTTYVGSPVDLGTLNGPTGDTLNWGYESTGLDYTPSSSGGAACKACELMQ
jgi:hypothetical protein